VDVNRSGPHALVRLDIRVAARPENVSAVRRAIETLDLPETLIDDAKLLVSELVTNSIRHAGLGPGEYIQITVTSSGRLLRVIVQDRTRHLAPSSVVGAIRPSPGAESGWGLYLVDRIASRWGTSLGRRAGYWFELNPRPGPLWASP
jgi:anti-sigma regulatory factor (Ser/Thr protein kinase)